MSVDVGELAAASPVARELLAKHGGSQRPESQQVCSVLGAALSVIASQGMKPSAAALFGATMAALQRQPPAPTAAALSAVLESALRHAPEGTVGAKLPLALEVVRTTLASLEAAAAAAAPPGAAAAEDKTIAADGGAQAAMRALLPCLGQLLRLEPDDDEGGASPLWAPGAPALALHDVLLEYALDARAKVRKTAVSAEAGVLEALRETAAGFVASEAALARLLVSVAAVEEAAAALAAAAGAGELAAKQAEAAALAAGTRVLHVLGACKRWLPAISGEGAGRACEAIVRIFTLRQPLLSHHAADALLAAVSAPDLPPAALAGLAKALLAMRFEEYESQTTVSLLRVLAGACARLHATDPAESAEILPSVFQAVVRLLSHPQDGVVIECGEALKVLVRSCVDAPMVQAGVRRIASAERRGAKTPIERVILAVESGLGHRYRDAWAVMLPVVAVLFERMGLPSCALLRGVLGALGEMGAARDLPCAVQLQQALGSAVRTVGVEQVVAVLPLDPTALLAAAPAAAASKAAQAKDMEVEGEDGDMNGDGDDDDEPMDAEEAAEAEDDDDFVFGPDAAGNLPDGRLWLIPLFRTYAYGDNIGAFERVLLPLAKELAARAEAAEREGRNADALHARALEHGVWALLPALCNWAVDTSGSFGSLARELGAHLQHRPELRPSICRALVRLLQQNRFVANGEEIPDGEEQPPAALTPEAAAANVASVVAFSRNFLPLLFNVFVSAPLERRIDVVRAIEAFAASTDAETNASFFRVVLKKLIKVTTDAEGAPDALLEGGSDRSSRRCTFLDLVLALMPGLDSSSLALVEKVALPAIAESDAAVQKKSYKLLARMCTTQPEFLDTRMEQLTEALASALPACVPSSRRNRLLCIGSVIPLLDIGERARTEGGEAKLRELLGELILGTKEANAKTRSLAYDLITSIAHRYAEAETGPFSSALDAMGEGLRRFFMMVLAGIAGGSPHMVSASVLAVSRLLYEFSAQLVHLVPELLPAMLRLLHGKSREVVKSALGFVKVVAVRLPEDELRFHLPNLVSGLLIWGDDSKNRFRSKVKVILERFVRRCGYESVEALVPEEHRPLISHIRKMSVREDKRRRASALGSEASGATTRTGATGRSGATGKMTGRTARTGVTAMTRGWRHEDVFGSDDEDGGRGGGRGGGYGGDARSGGTMARTRRSAFTGRSFAGGGAAPLRLSDRGGVDLLDDSSMRRMLPGAARGTKRGREQAAPASATKFQRSEDGRLIIDERKGILEERSSKRPRTREDGGARSTGGRSAKSGGGRSRGSAKTEGGRTKGASQFKAKKGTDGDKGGGAMQPFAYWPMDQKLLNRRGAKQREGRKGMSKVVVKAGIAKGAKAKRK
mmetsp:Transcript_28919/g.94534  ORF Transcript_28919/g.94534 Transcript_28919/m.94534 type:complete len:1369 (-) Transcript_28919:1378-5484(-)